MPESTWLDRLMTRDDVVDIHLQGCREVFVELPDGTIERHLSPFASDQPAARERTAALRRLAGRAGTDG